MLLLAALFISSSTAFAQFSPSFEGLSLNHPLEPLAFNPENTQGREAEIIALMLASDPVADEQDFQNIQIRLQGVCAYLKRQKLENRPLKKVVRIIYEGVHEQVLRDYEEQVSFGSLFRNGQYNCVTATVLYSLVFEHFGIPYEIQMEPTHVYPIVNPAEDAIAVETTTPVGGLLEYTQRDKEQYVEYLTQLKLIGAEERRQKSIQELFQKYCLQQNGRISLKQLAGIQYHNVALNYYEKKEYQAAVEAIEKAQYLYPSSRNEAIMISALYQQLPAMSSQDPESYQPLFQLARYFPAQEVENEILRQFHNLSEKLLIDGGDVESFGSYFRLFSSNCTNEATLEDISMIYYGQIGTYFGLNYRYDEALAYADSAYQLRPSNSQVKALLADIILNKLRLFSRNYLGGMELIQEYTSHYPFLKDNPYVRDFELFCLAQACEQLFNDEKAEEGMQYLSRFEEKLRASGSTSNSIAYISGVYSIASSFFFRADDYGQARKLLKKGLEAAPGDAELTRKLELLEDFIGKE